MADGATVANAYVQIMPSAQGAKENITDAILPAAESAGDSAGEAIGGGILGKLGELKGPLMALGGTLLAAVSVQKIASALMDIGGEFDEMTDAIIIGTGASGEALDALVGSAETIATTVPVSFGEAGDIVQNINTRMGLVGDELESVGERVAALGQLTGSAINLDTLTGALNQFGVAGEDAGAVMDYLWGVSQSTGISFDQLTGVLESNAPALQALGFSMEEAANMAGLLDKAGLDANGTMGKLSKALVELAQPGESAEDAFNRVVGQLGEYIEAGDEAAALDLASQIFGTRGATQFVAAVESGALSLEDLEDAALGAGDGIMGTLDATMDWPERFELLKNSAKLALEPLGGALMDAATQAMETLAEVMGEIDPAVFEELGAVIGDVLTVAVEGFAAALEFLVEHKEEIGAFFDAIKTAIDTVIEAVGPLVDKFVEIASSIPEAVGAMATTLAEKWETIKTKVADTWDGIKTKIFDTWESIKTKVTTAVESVKTKVATAFESVKTKVTTTWNGIKDAITRPIERAKEAVQNAVDRIKSIFNFKITWPHIPVPSFHISGSPNPLDWLSGGLPKISITWHAKGGYIDEPTILLNGVGEKGGEFVWPSYEPYLSRYAAAIADAMGDGVGTTNYYIDGAMVAADAQLAAALEVVAQRVAVRNRMGAR